MSFVGLIIVVWAYYMTLLHKPHVLLAGRLVRDTILHTPHSFHHAYELDPSKAML